MAPKLFEEQTQKGMTFITSMGTIVTYKCNNCEYEFSKNTVIKSPLICGKCGNV